VEGHEGLSLVPLQVLLGLSVAPILLPAPRQLILSPFDLLEACVFHGFVGAVLPFDLVDALGDVDVPEGRVLGRPLEAVPLQLLVLAPTVVPVLPLLSDLVRIDLYPLLLLRNILEVLVDLLEALRGERVLNGLCVQNRELALVGQRLHQRLVPPLVRAAALLMIPNNI